VGQVQRGLSLFGALVILAMAVVILYYAYTAITGGDGIPSCRSAHTDCLQNCRRTRIEAAALQSCQDFCQREAEVCERRSQ
jgi:hypothetical protein